MWITRLKIKHDCIIGNRCKKFQVTTTGTPFSVYIDKGVTHSPQAHKIDGEEKNVKAFIKDLKKDGKVKNLEVEGKIIFLMEVQKKQKVTASIFSTFGPKIIFVKPVFVDKEGYEYWEVASWSRKILTDFISGIIKEVTKDVEVLKIEETKLTDVYFSRLMPKLTENQHKAVMLALEKGYYSWPKKTDFGELSKLMKISVPTYREHLKRAEEKLMPDLVRLIQK